MKKRRIVGPRFAAHICRACNKWEQVDFLDWRADVLPVQCDCGSYQVVNAHVDLIRLQEKRWWGWKTVQESISEIPKPSDPPPSQCCTNKEKI